MSLLATVSMIVTLATTTQSVDSSEILRLRLSAVADMESTNQIDLHINMTRFFGSLNRTERLGATCTLLRSQSRTEFIVRTSDRFGFERASAFMSAADSDQLSIMQDDHAFFELKQAMLGLREEVYCVTTPF